MSTKIEAFNKTQLKSGLPDVRPGDTVRIHQKIKEGDKERSQAFEGLIIARKHGKWDRSHNYSKKSGFRCWGGKGFPGPLPHY